MNAVDAIATSNIWCNMLEWKTLLWSCWRCHFGKWKVPVVWCQALFNDSSLARLGFLGVDMFQHPEFPTIASVLWSHFASGRWGHFGRLSWLGVVKVPSMLEVKVVIICLFRSSSGSMLTRFMENMALLIWSWDKPHCLGITTRVACWRLWFYSRFLVSRVWYIRAMSYLMSWLHIHLVTRFLCFGCVL